MLGVLLGNAQSSVNDKHVAVDVAGCGRQEEDDAIGELLRVAWSLGRVTRKDALEGTIVDKLAVARSTNG